MITEQELKLRCKYPYSWGRKQSDNWDRMTDFIYDTKTFAELQEDIKDFDEELKNYAMNRWYNFWSAMGVEDIFAQHDLVIPNKNQYDKLVDFSIDGVKFDHKTTVFPKGFPFDYEYARANPKRLIAWLYENQSGGRRKHNGSRIFVVLKSDNEDWKMKSDLGLIKTSIDEYMSTFNKDNLTVLKYPNNTVHSDIIWVEA